MPNRRTLLAAGLAATVLAAPLAVQTADAASRTCAKGDTSYACAREGQILDVRLGDLRPTQPALGKDEVYYRLGRYTMGKDDINKKFSDWCASSGLLEVKKAKKDARLDQPSSFECELEPGRETKQSRELMKTVVIGPGGALYLTDGHHTMTSFHELPDGGADTPVRVRVVANLSDKSSTAFWAEMKKQRWTWLTTPDGKAVSPSGLPQSLGLPRFQDDPARSALYFTRDVGYEAGTVPFQEFYWGEWLRAEHPELLRRRGGSVDDHLDQTKRIAEAMVDLKGSDKVAGGFTAKQLGVMKDVDTGELKDLGKSMKKSEPGKLAYLVAYKEKHGIR